MDGETTAYLENLAKLVRYYILLCTEKAGSGHPTSSLSATDIMTGLMFGGFFLFDPAQPALPNNDRLIFSKGHATPLLYSLWTVAGQVTEEELMTYRTFGSPLQGHPTPHFRYVDAATGSLGQGLSIGLGMALNAKYLDKLPYRTYVLLGDSEMAEGSNWEAMQVAAHYKLDNLVGIIDVNRLGQRGETMYGWDVEAYREEGRLFRMGDNRHRWPPIRRDPSRLQAGPRRQGQTRHAHCANRQGQRRPRGREQERLARKGPQEGGRRRSDKASPAPRHENPRQNGKAEGFETGAPRPWRAAPLAYKPGEAVATRKAYGNALKRLYPAFPDMVVLTGR